MSILAERTDPEAPVVRLLRAAELNRIDLAARAGVSLPTIDKLASNGDAAYGMRVRTLMKVALGLGCAAAELLPELAVRPRLGLLWERGVFREPRGKQKRKRPGHWYGEKPELEPEAGESEPIPSD